MRTLLAHTLALASLLPSVAGASIEDAPPGGAPPAVDTAPETGPIDPGALPEDPAVRAAWADVLAQAPYAYVWELEWSKRIPKEEVAARLSASLDTLRRAAAKRPALELLLAVGVAGRLGHNVDVEGAAEAGLEALRRAVALGEGDPRAEWLLGGSLCHGNHVLEGWPHVERARTMAKGKPLPAAFWHEAIFCAAAANLPAHQREAWKVLEALGAGTRPERLATERLRGVILVPSLDDEYEVEETIDLRKEGERVWITSRACGFRFVIHGERPLRMPPVKKGSCMVESYAGPFTGKGEVRPGIFVLAHAAREGETSDSLLDMLAPPASRTPAKAFPCAIPGCRVFERRDPENYPHEGGGMAIVVSFARDEPEFPGLRFEEPSVPDQAPGMNYWAVRPRLGRLPGKISYAVVLDTAISVAPQAKEELRRFLSEFAAE